MAVSPVILQVVGYQNSGKTTAVENIIAALAAANLRVASCKHHGHGGKPALAEGKDSTRHLQAGAFASAVEGEGMFSIAIEDEAFQLEQWISFCTLVCADVLLIEGYKKEPYEKVVCIRKEEDKKLLQLANVVAVLSWIEIESTVPVFSIHDEKQYSTWVMEHIRRKQHV